MTNTDVKKGTKRARILPYAYARRGLLFELEEATLDGDYRRTRTLLQQKSLANAIFVRSFSRYPPAVAACSDALTDADAAVIEETLRRLNSRLSTVVVEGRDYEALLDLVTRIRDGVEGERDAGA